MLIHKLIFTLVICSDFLVFGQEPAEDTPPVPYLNLDGSIPAGHPERKVFLNRTTGDAVIVFDFVNESKRIERRLIQMELSRHIKPAIRTLVSHNPSTDLWGYDYTFSNGSEARQVAVSWWFKDLTHDTVSVAVPNGWDYLFPNIFEWPHLVVSTGSAVGVRPGEQLTGILVKSKLAPGLGEVYTFGSSRALELPAEPDDETTRQMQLVTGLPYNFRKSVALLPVVTLPTSIDQIVKEYSSQLRQCQSENQCTAKFVDAALWFLQTTFPSSSEKSDAFQDVSKAAERPLERELLDVFRLIFLRH